jgi:hypothetical protein
MGETMSEIPDSLPDLDDLDGAFVFHGRRLRDGVGLGETARFHDDLWPLAPAALQGQERGLTLRFDTVPPRYRMAAKRVCYTALSGALPPDEIRPSIVSIATYFYSIRFFFRWLEDDQGGRDLGEVTAEVLEQYQRFLLERFRSRNRRHHLRATVVLLWRYRHGLGPGGLRLDPRSVDAWSEPYRDAPRENSTARIPEEVHSRLLVWAQRFVDEFSEDILSSVKRWDPLRRCHRSSEGARPRNARGQAQARIRDYLEEALRLGRPLPGVAGQPSMFAIARTIGCDRRALDAHRAAITSAAQTLGVSEYAYLTSPSTDELTAFRG